MFQVGQEPKIERIDYYSSLLYISFQATVCDSMKKGGAMALLHLVPFLYCSEDRQWSQDRHFL